MVKTQVVFQLLKNEDKFIFGKKGPNEMLWSNINDLRQFKSLTLDDSMKSILIMGRDTFEQLKHKLDNRIHYVFSQKKEKDQIKNKKGENPDYVISSLAEFKELITSIEDNTLLSVIGGYELIKSVINGQNIHIHQHDEHTHVHQDYEIEEIYITIFEGDINKTGQLIEVEQIELQELLQHYQLAQIQRLDENINLYKYIRKEL